MISLIVMILVLIAVVCNNLIAIIVGRFCDVDIHTSWYWALVFGWPMVLFMRGLDYIESLSKKQEEAAK